MVKPMPHSRFKYVFLQPKYKISSQMDLNKSPGTGALIHDKAWTAGKT